MPPPTTTVYRHGRNFVRLGDWMLGDPPEKKYGDFVGTVVRIDLEHPTDDPTTDDIAAIHLCVKLNGAGNAIHKHYGHNRVLTVDRVSRVAQTRIEDFEGALKALA